MNGKRIVVTGAAGFVGRYVVNTLVTKGYNVVAGVHRLLAESVFPKSEHITVVTLDILDRNSVMAAMEEADAVYHFAALVDSESSKDLLCCVNAEGTKIVWECAAACGVKKALYCSTTAVYGLLARSDEAITEEILPRAIEPYGKTKLEGEHIALELAARYGLHTTIIRPVAIFGPGEHTPFSKKLKDAAISKLLIAGAFKEKKFNYVHVEDVAEAAVYLMENKLPNGEIFNITVNTPILFEEAFKAYIRVLDRLGRPFIRVKIMALLSLCLHRFPMLLKWISRLFGERILFIVWRSGFDYNYSSAKLLSTSFVFKHTEFEEVFYSCIGNK
jgi:dihydroflavonol-4-reductase